MGFAFRVSLALIAVTSAFVAKASPRIDKAQAGDASGEIPFQDCFEPNTVNRGDLDGQNEWKASPCNTVQVQTNIVWDGRQAILYNSATVTSEVSRLFRKTSSQVVWLDMHVIERGMVIPSEPSDQIAAFLFDANGRMIVQDGRRLKGDQWVTLTNGLSFATMGAWVRITVKMDFESQRWQIYLNGNQLVADLGFGKPSRDFHEFVAKGRFGCLDQFCVSTNTPPGLMRDLGASQTCQVSPPK